VVLKSYRIFRGEPVSAYARCVRSTSNLAGQTKLRHCGAWQIDPPGGTAFGRMDWLFLIGLTIASSIDNLAVAVSYGLRGIRIPVTFNLLIAAICFAFSEAGVLVGGWTAELLPGTLPDLVGAAVLFALGARILLLALSVHPRPGGEPGTTAGKGLVQKAERLLSASVDRIGWPEAVVLGIALSANALTNALGAGLIGLSAFAISAAAASGSFVTVALGVALGRRSAQMKIGAFDLGRYGTVLSALILLTIAVTKMI
jgi:putative sporulation protein YtaF